jgi:hypothetical protein
MFLHLEADSGTLFFGGTYGGGSGGNYVAK